MTSKAKQVQADMAQDLIENYIQDLTQDHALSVLHAIRDRFGWAGTMFTRDDIEHHIINAREADDLPDLTDTELAEWVDAIQNSWEWRKGIMEYLAETGWEMISNAYEERCQNLGVYG